MKRVAAVAAGLAIPETANFELEESPATVEMSSFAESVYKSKYSFEGAEEWSDTARRVTENVLGALGYTEDDYEFNKVYELIRDRKVMPAGRYLHAAGREVHQTQNCFLCRAEDNREGWAELGKKAFMILQTGGGFGADYSDIRPAGTPIKKTGGTASGPLPLMSVINEIGRGVMSGGSRRSAIIATLNWKHGDIFEFIRIKDWPEWLREAKADDMTVAAPMDMTNISVGLDDEFFEAFDDINHPLHAHARLVYEKVCDKMLTTAEPGFTVDVGDNAGENLRNPCITKENRVLTAGGYRTVEELLGEKNVIWTGKQWASDVVFEKTKSDVPILKVDMGGGRIIRSDETHEFFIERWSGKGERRKLNKIEKVPASELQVGDTLHISAPLEDIEVELNEEGYTLGWLYGDGSFAKAGGAELSLCSDESKDCASNIVGYNSINENDARGHTRIYFSVSDYFDGRSKEEFPEDLYNRTENFGLSFIAGLFDADGNCDESRYSVRLANKSPEFLRGVARLLEQYGIYANVSKNGKDGRNHKQQYQLLLEQGSVTRFLELVPANRVTMPIDYSYIPYRDWKSKVVSVTPDGVEDVYCANVMVEEHSFMCEGVIISNCGEVSSADDSDVCNLASLNMGRIETIEEFEEAIRYLALFMIAGTVYSDLPYDKVAEVRSKNRRLGMGIMGLHEWLVKRGYKYEPNDELAEWMEVYRDVSREAADKISLKHCLSNPVKVRAIAPTGTISIVAETTSGIEPIFSVAYKRRVRVTDAINGDRVQYEYVVDPTAKRLIEAGADPNNIEDAYTLAYIYEKRIQMQAFLQKYVDHAISVTVNLPYPITDDAEQKDFRDCLYEYLPDLRGFTAYPSGARGGQPITAVPYAVAAEKEGVRFEESEERCVGGICGS